MTDGKKHISSTSLENKTVWLLIISLTFFLLAFSPYSTGHEGVASCVACRWYAFAWYANRRSSVRLLSPLGEDRQPIGGRRPVAVMSLNQHVTKVV